MKALTISTKASKVQPSVSLVLLAVKRFQSLPPSQSSFHSRCVPQLWPAHRINGKRERNTKMHTKKKERLSSLRRNFSMLNSMSKCNTLHLLSLLLLKLTVIKQAKGTCESILRSSIDIVCNHSLYMNRSLIRRSPISPAHMDWTIYYPAYAAAEPETSSGDKDEVKSITKDVEVADIGCGFGGLLVALAPKLPDTLLLGKEL
jgi:hypothetical protein